MTRGKLSNNLKNIKIFLVGDFFLDEYIYGEMYDYMPESAVVRCLPHDILDI